MSELFQKSPGFDAVFSLWHRRNFDRNGIEVEVLNASGQPIHLHVALYGTFTDAGLSRIWMVLRDCSPLNRAIAAIAKTENHYRSLLDQPDLILFRLDPEGTIQYTSSHAKILVGDVEVRGHPLSRALKKAVHPDDLARLVKALSPRSKRHAGSQSQCSESSLRILLPHGAYAPARCSVRNHTNIANDVDHIDILFSLPSALLASVDPGNHGALHDLNNHLLIARANAELALRSVSSTSPAFTSLRSTLQAIDQCSRMTSAQLGHKDATSPTPARISVASVLEDIANECRAILPPKVVFDVILPPPAIEVWVDEQHLRQILVNLIVNAKDALNGEGTITVSATTRGNVDASAKRVRGREVCISVSDDGPGIPEPLARRLFTQRTTTKHHKEGHGLGLLMVKKLCDANRGEIVVTTSKGTGSTFTLILSSPDSQPSIDDFDDSRASALKSATPAPLSVLIADDEAPIRDVLLTALTLKGYQAIGVSDSRSLHHELSNNRERYDLAVVDGGLTSGARTGTIEAIRALPQDIPIIVISGDHILGKSLSSADLSVRFLPKPFALETLYTLISESTNERASND